MKYTLIIFISVLLLGCDPYSHSTKQTLKYKSLKYDLVCIDGVEYILRAFSSGGLLAPKWNNDGTISTCKENKYEYK